MVVTDLNSLSKEELIEIILKQQKQKDEVASRLYDLENKLKQSEDRLKQSEDKLIQKEEEFITLQKDYKKLSELLIYYELLRYNKHRISLADTDAPTLFDVMGIEEPESVTFEGEETVVAEHVRKSHPKAEHLDYSHLPHETAPGSNEVADDMICSNCGETMRCYKTEKREELVYVPAQAKVLVHYVHYYKCENCVDDNDHNPCRKGDNEWKPLFERSLCSSSLLASIIDYKYDKGLPLNTIERTYKENGIILPRQNMSNWLIQSMKYIEPLYELMHKDLLTHDVLCADETTMQVLREEGKPATSTSYLWLYQTTDWDKRIVLYDYEPGRSGNYAAKFLSNYEGYLLSDKYAGYNKVEGAKRCHCHVHAFRYIRECVEILPKGSRSNSLEQQAYKLYKKVFEVDRNIYEKASKEYPLDINKQLKYVEEHRIATKNAFEVFSSWLESIKPQIAMKPKFLRTVKYILNDHDGFLTFMEDPRIPLGNNRSEQLIRPFTLIRQRCKFFVSSDGADAAAKIYSLMMTAKENGYTTYGYFRYLFDNLRYIDLKDEEALRKFLPYEHQLPDYCKMYSVKELKTKIKALEADAD